MQYCLLAALKLDSVSFTSVPALLLQWYTGPLCPLRQKPRDVIKCCMFTLSQQDTDQRRTWKAKLINTVSLWTYTADNQSALPAWIRESVQKTHNFVQKVQFTVRIIYSQVVSTFIRSAAMQTCYTLTQGHTLAHKFWSQASMTWGSFCPTSPKSEQTKDYAIFISIYSTCSQPCPTLDSLTLNRPVLTGDAKAAFQDKKNTTRAPKRFSLS